MKARPKVTSASPLCETLEGLNVDQIKPLAPTPDKFVTGGLDVLPESGASRMLIAETEAAALHDIAATLSLIAEGKTATTPATARPASIATFKLAERLLHGEFLLVEEKQQDSEPIRAFGWLMLAQEAKWAKSAGSKLVRVASTRCRRAYCSRSRNAGGWRRGARCLRVITRAPHFHSGVAVRSPELTPGASAEAIVLVDTPAPQRVMTAASLLESGRVGHGLTSRPIT